MRMAIEAYVAPAKVIAHDEEDVGSSQFRLRGGGRTADKEYEEEGDFKVKGGQGGLLHIMGIR